MILGVNQDAINDLEDQNQEDSNPMLSGQIGVNDSLMEKARNNELTGKAKEVAENMKDNTVLEVTRNAPDYEFTKESAFDTASDRLVNLGDHLGGSVDESIGRQFDDQEGGGIVDYDTIAGMGDHLAGSTDEAVGRTVDDAKDAVNDTVETVQKTTKQVIDGSMPDIKQFMKGATISVVLAVVATIAILLSIGKARGN